MAKMIRGVGKFILILCIIGIVSTYVYTTHFKIISFKPTAEKLVLKTLNTTTATPHNTAKNIGAATKNLISTTKKTNPPTKPPSTIAPTTTLKPTGAKPTTIPTTVPTPTTTPQPTKTTLQPPTTTPQPPTTTLQPTTTTPTPTTTTPQPTTTTPTPTTSTTTAAAKPVYTCSFPILDPFDPAIMKYINKHPPLTCDGKPSVAYVEGNKLKINQEKLKKKVGSVEFCQYSPLKLSPANDVNLQDRKWSSRFLDTINIPDDLEHLIVQCVNKKKVVAETYKSRVFEKPEVEKRSKKRYANHVKKNSPAETMSVLFVGMDGMSKQNLIRGLPKTRDFILKSMNAKELNMFNKVGDNTFQNIIVLMSGKTHGEFGKIKGWSMKKNYFDEVDDMMVWNAYQKAGYRTASIFDIIYGTAFHYLKKGWKEPPFDYYHRPGPLMMDRRSHKGSGNCVGDQREVTLLLDYYLELTTKFNNTKTKPYFAYSFFTHLTHDFQNDASTGDEMYLEFFTKLHNNNVLNNTITVFFSDHGLRFGDMRRTFNGFVEGRSPYFFLMFPPWFEEKYQKEMSILQTNQNRLTTFFDIHATLYDILHFKGKKSKKSHSLRGMSLFQDIPASRTCDEAHIPAEYCLCKDMSKKKVPDDLKQILAEIMLDIINERTDKNRDICADLSLKSIRSVLNFNAAESDDNYYQVTIQTTPGDGDFEALLDYHAKDTSAGLVGDIVRLNFYKGQDGCVNTLALKPYCYCK